MGGVAFYGRQDELAALEAQYRRGSAFIVLYGRRRVGKTSLIKKFSEDKDALYFLASREGEELNRRRFAQAVAEFTGNQLLATASFDDWRPLFEALAQAMGDRRYVVAIDELPYLISANKALPSVLQYVWDEVLSKTNCTLILCGSSVSMMRDEVLSRESPLYGRRTMQMRLKPLSFGEVRSAVAGLSYERAVDLYAVTGGVPKYLEVIDCTSDILDSVCESVFSTYGFLYEEPEFLMGEETRGGASYLSILAAVANGRRKVSEMSAFLAKKAQDLSPYLKTLVELGYLERRTPFDEKYPERSKRGLYYVSDSFLLFWLTYVLPFRSELEMGNMRPSIEAFNRSFRKAFVPFEFERICSQDFARLCTRGTIDFTPSRISGYWDKSGQVELDVCAEDHVADRVFLGECKYYAEKPVGIDELNGLVAKAQSIEACRGNDVVFGLFSHTGFSDAVLERAQEMDVVLIDKGVVLR